MRWEELTGSELAAAAQETQGLCLLPVSCVEQHGARLPLGTDLLIARELATRVAALENAVVFPDIFFGQILEGRAEPGAIGISLPVVMQILSEVCAEIARNGFPRIVLINGHGGNTHMLKTFVQGAIERRVQFQVYLVEPQFTDEELRAIGSLWESERPDCHGGESETSQILAIRPDLVRSAEEAKPERPLDRYGDLGRTGVFNALWFYADHPDHFCGDPSPATGEKGDVLLDVTARALARGVAAVRSHEEIDGVHREFFDRARL